MRTLVARHTMLAGIALRGSVPTLDHGRELTPGQRRCSALSKKGRSSLTIAS